MLTEGNSVGAVVGGSRESRDVLEVGTWASQKSPLPLPARCKPCDDRGVEGYSPSGMSVSATGTDIKKSRVEVLVT